MELLISNIKGNQDVKLFKELAERLGLKAEKLTMEEKENLALSRAIEEGRESGYIAEEKIMKTLHKIQRKK